MKYTCSCRSLANDCRQKTGGTVQIPESWETVYDCKCDVPVEQCKAYIAQEEAYFESKRRMKMYKPFIICFFVSLAIFIISLFL